MLNINCNTKNKKVNFLVLDRPTTTIAVLLLSFLLILFFLQLSQNDKTKKDLNLKLKLCAKEVTKLSPATTVGFAASLSDTKEREHCLQQKKG